MYQGRICCPRPSSRARYQIREGILQVAILHQECAGQVYTDVWDP